MDSPKLKLVHNRILMLLENLPYPQDYRVRRESVALAAAGYKVTVISPAAPGQPRHETIGDVDVYRFPAPPEASGMLSYVWEYLYTMTVTFFISLYVFFQQGFDVVHVHQPPDTYALIAGFYKLFGKKYVFDHHDLAPELYEARFRGRGKPFLRNVLLLFEQIACRLANQVIATNESYRRIEMERGGVPASHITIVRNGPNLNEIDREAIKPDVHINGKTIIGYEGVMGIQDGVDHLLRAIWHLVFELKQKDILCLIVGDGSAMERLQTLVQELGIADFVTFTGWIYGHKEVRRYVLSMDICAAPEPSDPYNERSTAAKVMEYMAAGKPIVAFDIPEHRSSAQGAALYAKPNDDLDFARNIQILINDPEKRESLGKIGRERIEKELAWEFQVTYLVEAYRNLFSENTN
jgi:glycosyltransferase involved in cell wall biosynthesis